MFSIYKEDLKIFFDLYMDILVLWHIWYRKSLTKKHKSLTVADFKCHEEKQTSITVGSDDRWDRLREPPPQD